MAAALWLAVLPAVANAQFFSSSPGGVPRPPNDVPGIPPGPAQSLIPPSGNIAPSPKGPALQSLPPGANPGAVVRQAVQGAAQQLAPGLLSNAVPRLRLGPARPGRRGVWVRRGRTITLYGV